MDYSSVSIFHPQHEFTSLSWASIERAPKVPTRAGDWCHELETVLMRE